MTRQEILEQLQKARTPKEKKPYKGIAKKSAKKIAKEKEEKESFGDTPLDNWFEQRREEMKGFCVLCGGKSEKNNDATYRHSIAHLFPKKENFGGFPSIATHEENWMELCYYGNSCHTNFDNHIITWELLRDSAEWLMIVEKFKNIYPFIAQDERKNVPEILLNELKS